MYAYLEMRHTMRHTEEMKVSEAEEALEETLLHPTEKVMKEDFVEKFREDTIDYMQHNITHYLEDSLPCSM